MSEELLLVEDLHKEFVSGDTVVEVLRSVSFSIRRGEFVCFVGSSGAGKTTLLHIIGTLLRPSSGVVSYDDNRVFDLSEAELARFRNKRIGFVFQFHHLLPEFNAVENAAMPLLIGRTRRDIAQSKAKLLLDGVGLSHRYSHRPAELSFGEQQRVAVARALVGEPEIVMADEPTGNLDWETGQNVFTMLLDLTIRKGRTLVVVTHNQRLAAQADKVLRLVDGKCVRDPT